MMYAIDTRETDYENAYLEDYKDFEEYNEWREKDEDEINSELVVKANDMGYFLYEMGKIPLCTPEEEKEYFRKIKAGDMEAKKEFATRNLRLVVNIAKKSRNFRVEFADHVQFGFEGLYKAIDKFEPEKGFRFSTYATWWIRQAIARYTADTSRAIRVPIHVHEEINRMYRVEAEFEKIHARIPTYKELAELLKFPVERIQKLKEITLDMASLNVGVGEEEDTMLMEFIPSVENVETQVEEVIKKEKIEKVLDVLSSRERTVLKMRFGIGCTPKTLEACGNILGVTRERVRQIEAKALRRLRVLTRKDFVV